MSALQGRGEGFVHPNTPASIQYTAGQKLSLADLRRRSSRVECVVLPASQSIWRLASQCYTSMEGYASFAGDLEDERAGEGPLLPPLSTRTRKRPRYDRATGAETTFFVGRRTTATPPAPLCPTAESSGPSLATSAHGVETKDAGAPASASVPAGIAIVTHHKVSGRGQFVYPDYDGVLSSGVVPEVVASAEEHQEEAQKQKYFLCPSDMTAEEQEAFEALQKLWQARARSRSAQGAQWRDITENVHTDGQTHASSSGHPTLNRPAAAGHAGSFPHAANAGGNGADDEVTVADPAERDFAEALRVADELLRFL